MPLCLKITDLLTNCINFTLVLCSKCVLSIALVTITADVRFILRSVLLLKCVEIGLIAFKARQ